uniref:Zinc finger protein VAR3ic n=2 Tax=Rhizophora mucronata TaxID=61149 RepID=A0A2P2IWN0_RHIMU
MSVLRLLLSDTLFFRCTNNTHRAISSRPPFLSLTPFLSKPLQFLRYTSSASASASAAAADSIVTDKPEANITSLQPHPWPEWVTFVDRLKTRGYFAPSPAKDNISTADYAAVSNDVYVEISQLKDACLSFARDRYDIFKSLSVPNIQTAVEVGCPNLFRKVVNSAKRLRAYAKLDEGDVCGACNLRGSCDRAYVMLKDSEADARTVDIVRILLSYALDPLVVSGEKRAPGGEIVEEAARKLLAELIELSERAPDPALQRVAVTFSSQKERDVNFGDIKLSQNSDMKMGDWMCPKCNFLNFARNKRCLKCKEEGPKGAVVDGMELKKGDWICPKCNFMNFWKNIECKQCKVAGPRMANSNDREMKKGDWNCSQCGFMNFASNRKCLRCQGPRPKRQLNPGEWECPSCDFLNYRRNAVCLKCNCERPRAAAATTGCEDWLSRSPH